MKMKAVRYYAPNDIRYEETRIPELQEGEILVKVEAALTCGTDVKTFRRGHPVLIKKTPSGFGHEFSGIVERIDEAVTNVKIGDRVVCANSAPCGECFYCQREEYELCENLNLLNGAYAQYIVVPKRIVEKNTLIIPSNLTFAQAAFAEPLSNVVHGIAKTPIKKGDVVGVMGIGPIGLMFALLAKLKGAKVIAMGRNPLKLKLAKEFAHADVVIDITKHDDPTDIIMSHTTEGRGLDVAIECVGLPQMWEKMFSLVRKGGYVHFFGGCASGSSVNLDTRRLHYDEVKIISSFHHTPLYFRKALELISNGEIDVDKLITKKMDMKYAKRAIEMHRDGEAIKILLEN
ncbi:MAG: alcohol dehydrogenase catalytic domain-containing protein [Candidatus Gastranaerophilales bacterium]|nr:alcohol dehydrogenase catalytic domain-containing protein [Candidatus Gastranaerophilales bacterium]